MYVFLIKNSTTVYAYTNDKIAAFDFNEINKGKYRMVKLSKSDLKEGINLPSGGNITYFKLYGEDDSYMVPMTEIEANKVMTAVLEIESKFPYIHNEIVSNNKYGLKHKYLNLIDDLTSVLKKKHNMFLEKKNPRINSLKIYNDLIQSEGNCNVIN